MRQAVVPKLSLIAGGALVWSLWWSHLPSATGQDQWLDWRGPQHNGHADAAASPPTQFSASSDNLLWKSAVPGRGHASPTVVEGRVILATADEAAKTQSVVAYDLSDGSQLWTTEISRGGFPANNHPKNTEASSTVISDGDRLYATFFHHLKIELVCLDLSGQIVWRQDVCPFNPQQFEYGFAPSPLLYKGKVIVAAEYDGKGSSLTALNAKTGRAVWRSPRTPSISFSSPVVANVAGRDQLLLSGNEFVMSYNPANGRPYWQVKGTTSATCGTMVWSGDIAIASGGFPKAETLAVRADGSGRVLWRNKQKCYEQSMIVVDDHVYGLTDRGILYCWAVSDGTERWKERLEGPVSASPIYAGGNIYWANERGRMFVFKPNPERFELVAENRLGDESFASPTAVGTQLLLRVAHNETGGRQEYLYCFSDR